MPNETFDSIKHWPALELDILRRLITRELHRRWDHEADSTQKKDGSAQGEPQAVKPESDL